MCIKTKQEICIIIVLNFYSDCQSIVDIYKFLIFLPISFIQCFLCLPRASQYFRAFPLVANPRFISISLRVFSSPDFYWVAVGFMYY